MVCLAWAPLALFKITTYSAYLKVFAADKASVDVDPAEAYRAELFKVYKTQKKVSWLKYNWRYAVQN